MKSGIIRKEKIPIDQMELKLFKNGESPRLSTNSRLVYYRMLKEFQEEGEPEPPMNYLPSKLQNKDPTFSSRMSENNKGEPFLS